MTRLERIDAVIQRTEDKKVLKLLSRLWWKEWFRVYATKDNPCNKLP